MLIVKALTKAFADLERDGSKIILYVDDAKLSGTIADIIASRRHPDTAGSGQVWERFLFQLRRHDVMVGKFDRSEANAKSLLARLDELLSEESD